MSEKRISHFAKWLSTQPPEHFNFCETSACIAGHYAAWANVTFEGAARQFPFPEVLDLMEADFGLTEYEIEALCVDPLDEDGNYIPSPAITQRVAVEALHRLADTGEIYFTPEEPLA